MTQKHYTITEIVGTIYCEQKAVFDHTYGEAKPLSVKAKAWAGTVEHYRFQGEGHARQVMADRRCYVATYIYGDSGIETLALRLWRDQVLRTTPTGRLAIAIYYVVSPALVRMLGRSTLATRLVKGLLDRLIPALRAKV